MNIKNDRVLLLSMLREIVNKEIEAGSINTFIDEEVSNFLIDVTDKRRVKKLKQILKEVDIWLKELVQDQKLREEERKYNLARMKEVTEHANNLFDSP